MSRMVHVGNVTIPADVDVWPHELKTAQALAAAGHDVRYVRKSDELRTLRHLLFVNHHGKVVEIR